MKILVTGAKGFVGKNLCESLKCIAEGKDRTRPSLQIDEIFQYDIDTEPSLLDEYCQKADFVFHLAGVNRPQNPEEFMQGNFGFTNTLYLLVIFWQPVFKPCVCYHSAYLEGHASHGLCLEKCCVIHCRYSFWVWRVS